MPKFDKRFVHFMWDDELEGKEVLYADDVRLLVKEVNEGKDDRECVKESDDYDYQFLINNASFRFVYYDPYYNLKVANEQGKVIQGKHRLTGEWIDIEVTNINWEMMELRVKPEETKPESKPVTNRELAKWLSQGNGEMCYYNYESCTKSCSFTQHNYNHKTENEPCKISEWEVRVRRWEDTEWHLPTREYMGLED